MTTLISFLKQSHASNSDKALVKFTILTSFSCIGDKQLYTVLEQQQAQIAQGNLMGSDHTYVIPQAGAGTATQERRPAGGAARR